MIITFSKNLTIEKMKKVLIILIVLCINATYAQQMFTVNGETVVLNKETDGPVNFLWNSVNGQFRYFIQTENDEIIELTNTKNAANEYNEEYKDVLYEVTGMNPAEARLTTYSLKDFIKRYNRSKDPNYNTDSNNQTTSKKSKKNRFRDRPFDDRQELGWRFGSTAGFTNLPYVYNPEGTIFMSFYAELEAFEESDYPRHSLFLGVEFMPFETIQENENNQNIDYFALQPSLGYRFRFVNRPSVNFYLNTRFAAFTYSEKRILTTDNTAGSVAANKERIDVGRNFTIPFTFGIGTDIKVKKNGYITLLFDSLFSVFSEFKNKTFPLDMSIGYKFDL